METKLVGNLSSVHGVLEFQVSRGPKCVLWRASMCLQANPACWRRPREERPQLVLVQHALELLTCLNNTVAIVAVDDEDDT